MNATEALAVIKEIAATSSKNDKEALVAKHIDDSFFLRVLIAALDPFITYGIKKLPKADGHGERNLQGANDPWDMLLKLSQRRLTGNAAQDMVKEILETLDEASQTLLTRIILKDLRAGFSRNTINRVKSGTIATFDCMLAKKYEEKRLKGKPHAIEPKVDGVRVLAFISESGVGFYSRSGKEYTGFDHLIPPLLRLGRAGKGIVMDGEVVSGDFNKTVGDVRRKNVQATDAVFYAFDVVSAVLFKGDKGNETETTYEMRRKVLEACVKAADSDNVKALPRYLVDSHDEILAYYAKFRERGWEGAMVKPLDSIYTRKRSSLWMKIKNISSEDIRVTGVFEGTGKYEGAMGGIICDFNGVEVRVGGGFSDEERTMYWESQNEIIGRLVEVEYHEVTPDGSLRHPRFIRFRDDKPVEEAA